MPIFRFSDEKDVPYSDDNSSSGCWGFLTGMRHDIMNTRSYYRSNGGVAMGTFLGFPYNNESLPSFIQIPEQYGTGVERLESVYNELIVKAPQWFDGIEFIDNKYLRVPTNIPFGRAYNSLRLLRNALRQGNDEWKKTISAPLTTPQSLFAIDMYYGGTMHTTDSCIMPRLAMENMNAIIKRFEDGVDLIEDNNTPLISDDTGVIDLFNRYGYYTISQFLEPNMREPDFDINHFGGDGRTRDGSLLPQTIDDFIKGVSV